MIDQNSQFFAILTNVGVAKQANADALGIAWKITQMGVGDANNADPLPSATQTALIHEWRRAPLNQLKVDPNNAAIIIAEQVIPADVGGHWIREIGLYDADGDLVAVANCAPSFKPLLNQGSGRTQVVRMNLQVSNASSVELKIDPSVVLATRTYVDQKVVDELGRLDFKPSVRAAATAAIVLSGLQTVDGVALVSGDRVLVPFQAAAKDNGIYVVAAGAWARSIDADLGAEVTAAMLVPVEEGGVNGDSLWQLVTNGPIVLGTTALTFEMLAGRTGVQAGDYRSITVDKYGRVTGGANPTTLAGYAISPATQLEAETGTDNAKPMTALRVWQVVSKAVVQATETVFGWAKVATQVQTDAGVDDATIVTPKKLRAGFAVSLAPNGYIAFPSWLGGLVVQWGAISNVANASTSTNFTMSFPNNSLAVVLVGFQGTGNQQAYAVLNSQAKSSFVWSGFHAVGGSAPILSTVSGQVQGRYIAVGC